MCPLLYKAIADNDSTIPGYTYEEIIKISFLSHQHRTHLLDFLLSKITTLRWPGKQKIVRILLQLCQRGHPEIRVLLRRRDGDLRHAASQGGPPDPLLANTPHLFFNASVQELLSYIFDQNIVKTDEEMMSVSGGGGVEALSKSAAVPSGYGSSGHEGKYEGFGNSAFSKPDSLVDQMREMVGKVVPSETRRREELEELLKGDKGNYQPLSLSSSSYSPLISPPPSAPHPPLSGTVFLPPSLPSMSRSLYASGKAHVAGKVGGGWGSESEEEEEEEKERAEERERLERPSLTSETRPEVGSAPFLNPISNEKNFLQHLLDTYTSWPVDFISFMATCKECVQCNPFNLLNDLANQINGICSQVQSRERERKTLAELGKGSIKEGNRERKGELEKYSIKAGDTGREEELQTNSIKAGDTERQEELQTNSIKAGDTERQEELQTNSLNSTKGEERSKEEHNLSILLLFIEFSLNEDLVSVPAVRSHLESALGGVAEAQDVCAVVRTKAKKIRLIIKALAAYA